VELRFGPFRLDTEGRRLWRGEHETVLTPKALDLLIYLANHAGTVLSREQLLEALWPGTYVDDHALSVQIGEIRKALGDGARDSNYVETRHRRGYCFKADVQRGPPVAIEAPTPAVPLLAVPETKYARSGDVNIAYQVLGDGPIDLVFVMGWVSHLEYFWKEPSFARFLRRLASFSRLIVFDKRGTGLSDRVPLSELPSLERRMDDLRTVMVAAGSSRAAICGISEGGPMSALFAATYPEKTLALVMIGTYAKRVRDDDYPWGPTAEERERFIQEIQDHWGGPVGLEERAPSMASDPQFRDGGPLTSVWAPAPVRP
jgi:DNA-binding winged helix-turn-helix (wHTH) protein